MLDITIKSERPRVEELFAPYRTLIGQDFDGYRNHVYRCITYAMHFLDNASEHEQMVETAFVYHDIGLWTDQELAYLEPSEAVALQDNDKYGWGLDPDALRGAIHWHHKVFKYEGMHADVIEACRKADWIDATQGWCRKGMPRSAIAKVEFTFRNCGFHKPDLTQVQLLAIHTSNVTPQHPQPTPSRWSYGTSLIPMPENVPAGPIACGHRGSCFSHDA